jgi:hypothetical protein
MRLPVTVVAALSALAWFTAPALAQPSARPEVSGGTVIEQSAAQGLAAVFRHLTTASGDPVWIGYAVPMIAGDHRMCCGSSSDCCGGCRLEPGQRSDPAAPPPAPAGTVRLEPADLLFVLFRVEGGTVERIRTFSETCRLDAGGRTIHWLTGVRPSDSVTQLAGYATQSATRRTADAAVSAVAMHADPSALDWLIGAARTGATTHVRGQALFWLSQRAGARAIGTIAEAVDRDPDTEVKRRAVFALSQLPPDDGVPRLLEIARSHSNPVVRKQAFFWLGQSKDARALAFFQSILLK